MRTLTVLPVGNGACSLVRDYGYMSEYRCSLRQDPVEDSLTIIDCGRGNSRGREAAQTLSNDLSVDDWRNLDSLVITHYDADHWRGLHYLASGIGPPSEANLRAKIKIYAPAIPFGIKPDLLPNTNALISMTSASGVEALDVKEAWASLTSIEVLPRADGDIIHVAGLPHRVVWPPRNLGHDLTTHVNGVTSRISALADRLANEGHHQLKKAIETAKEYSLPTSFPDGSDEVSADDAYADIAHSDSKHHEIDSENGDSGVNLEDISPESQGPAVPRNLLTEEERNLVKEARGVQNLLSLVFHDEKFGSLLVYGDAPFEVVTHLTRQLRGEYWVMLAPHHGTHSMPTTGPICALCIAQGNERSFRPLWDKYHLPTHAHSINCVHVTSRGGRPLHVPLPAHSPRCDGVLW
jgi:Metallo-beta-lactamase superfamily